ncbi:hypothetical protein CIHG_08325 [Coccidioides immitis H538.4]|uniref:Uncharacterized protein n=1 Tax=Coccidioides immitis H538.4 TaxID=396776 RepID=A0A0J8S2M8_COCIT|nr:hypothetical protein CIHG_08325 [Coccidioides immitis H538.4]
MAQNMFDNLKDKLAIQLDKPPEDVETQKENKRQNNTTANPLNKIKNIVCKQADIFYHKIFEQTCSHLKYKDMTDLELDDGIMKKIHTLLAIKLEHMNLDNSLLTDLSSLPSSDKTDNNNRKNEAPEDGTENSNKEIKKSDTNSQKYKTSLHI